ncbi:Tyrosine/serine protein phosphatase [Balamuthia mandrillaris]
MFSKSSSAVERKWERKGRKVNDAEVLQKLLFNFRDLAEVNDPAVYQDILLHFNPAASPKEKQKEEEEAAAATEEHQETNEPKDKTESNDVCPIFFFKGWSTSNLSSITYDKITPGKIYRSAAVSRSLMHAEQVPLVLAWLKTNVGVRTIIDLRDAEEKSMDAQDLAVEAEYPTLDAYAFMSHDEVEYKRYNVSLVSKTLRIKLFTEANAKTQATVLKAVASGGSATKTFSRRRMNRLGLLGLSKMMLIYAQEEIVLILRICRHSLTHNSYPILYHCSSGKDRTGLITALLLALCGVPEELILLNYHRSEWLLQPVHHLIAAENQKKGLEGFDGTPPEVMKGVLQFVEDEWGGVPQYLTSIGFAPWEQRQLVIQLTGSVPSYATTSPRALLSSSSSSSATTALQQQLQYQQYADQKRGSVDFYKYLSQGSLKLQKTINNPNSDQDIHREYKIRSLIEGLNQRDLTAVIMNIAMKFKEPALQEQLEEIILAQQQEKEKMQQIKKKHHSKDEAGSSTRGSRASSLSQAVLPKFTRNSSGANTVGKRKKSPRRPSASEKEIAKVESKGQL